MSVLNQLSDVERALVTSLPYRVGLYVSMSDTSGGDESDARELKALSDIIDGFSADVFGSELLVHIMHETVARRGEWPAWAEAIDKVPEEARMAIGILDQHIDQKEINAVVTRLMEIAEAVAVAFREYEQTSKIKDFKLYVTYLKIKIKAMMNKHPYRSFDQFLYISMDERQALNHLARALNSKYIV